MAVLGSLTPTFVYLLLTATLGPLLFGYHLAELNAPEKVIRCINKNGQQATTLKDRVKSAFGKSSKSSGADTTLPQCIPMNPTQFGLVSSSFTLGGLIGALSAGPVSSKYGRLKTMILLSAFAVVGPVFEAAAPNVGVFALGRLASGIGAGGATVVVPIYISEISPPSKRGFFGAFTQILTNTGILITQALGLFLSRGQLWRIILGAGGVLALVQMVGLTLGGRESPAWLADNGQPTKAKDVLRKLRGKGAELDDEVAALGSQDGEDEEARLLASEHRSNNNKDKKQTIGFFGVLKHLDTRPAVMSVVAIMVSMRMSFSLLRTLY